MPILNSEYFLNFQRKKQNFTEKKYFWNTYDKKQVGDFRVMENLLLFCSQLCYNNKLKQRGANYA